VTLSGFAFIVLSYLLTYLYVPTLVGVAPSWVYYVCALNLFVYQTMDALDGKQARRTQSSSPLGELFDHGTIS
jgi:ethanolaminephosphotransferase